MSELKILKWVKNEWAEIVSVRAGEGVPVTINLDHPTDADPFKSPDGTIIGISHHYSRRQHFGTLSIKPENIRGASVFSHPDDTKMQSRGLEVNLRPSRVLPTSSNDIVRRNLVTIRTEEGDLFSICHPRSKGRRLR